MKSNVYRAYPMYVVLLFAGLLAGWGCAKEKAPVPAWIEIDSMGLQTIGGQGSSSHRFTDAWLYINSNLVGAFEVPARVPVIAEGNTRVMIYPGVQLNGMTSQRTPYLKTVRYDQYIDLVPTETVKINPVYKYDSLVLFRYLEDFEGSSITLNRSEGSNGDFIQLSNAGGIAFEGNGCGMLSYDGAENTSSQVETNDWFLLPKGDMGGIYFEFNYKCNTSFTVSVLAKPNDGAVTKIGIIGLNATDVWKKVYVALSPTTNGYTAGNLFKPVIGFARQTDISKQEVYIDNLKILY